MDDTTKYLIHARIAANGVVERSDVVGAVFGQTEGLLGDELDLRDLQQSSKVGRIDVQIDSENGQSFGELTIATSLDKAETAILGASLETIERVGPCRAGIEITEIEDVRAAKRRAVISRAKELLATAFDETVISSEELIADVRESVRVEDITEYDGLPAGPSVATSDAIIVVEGRSDVLQLLKYGIKNAIAVEGTNVPEAVASLTTDRTATVFVDGDRGGELILRELLQVGDVDYVAFAPPDRSVEDLSRTETLAMLREKVASDRLGDVPNIREAIARIVEETAGLDATDRSAAGEDGIHPPTESSAASESPTPAARAASTDSVTEVEVVPTSSASASDSSHSADSTTDGSEPRDDGDATFDDDSDSTVSPPTLRSHVRAVIEDGLGTTRLLSAEFESLAEIDPAGDADAVIAAIDGADEPFSLIIDGELTQRILDAAAQGGLDHVVARSTGEFVKKPVGTRVMTADQLRPPEREAEVEA